MDKGAIVKNSMDSGVLKVIQKTIFLFVKIFHFGNCISLYILKII